MVMDLVHNDEWSIPSLTHSLGTTCQPAQGDLTKMRSMTESRRFAEYSKASFHAVDVDNTNSLDFKELYIALLLFYDKMNAMLPVHVEVPSREKVEDYLKRFDKNNTGHLEVDEFLAVSKELFGSGRSWKDSIYFKAGTVIVLNMVIWPLLGLGTQKGLLRAGVGRAAKVPVAVWSFAAQGLLKLAASSLF